MNERKKERKKLIHYLIDLFFNPHQKKKNNKLIRIINYLLIHL